jgi:peptide/nickel transport system ATP-binding protein
LITIENLSIEFGTGSSTVKAVNNVSLKLEKGKSLGLVGESGSGKSITALSIMQLLPPQAKITDGRIIFAEGDLLKLNQAAMSKLRGNKISMIFQEPMTSLNPVMRCGKQVTESIRQHQQVSSKDARNKVLQLFDKVKLPRPESIFRSYPHQISGGQKQRVMIAMAIANNPDLLIADEPTTALDVTVQKEIIKLLNELRDEYNMSLLFISHDLGVVAEVADDVAVMYKGQIVEQGKKNDVFKNPKHPYTMGLMACRPAVDIRLERLPTIDEFIGTDGVLRLENNFNQIIVADGERNKRLVKMYQSDPLIKVDNLEKIYTQKTSLFGRSKQVVRAVDKVSLQVFRGETLGLVGESGCGKTTLGRSILRLIEPDSGQIYFEEKDLLAMNAKQLKVQRQHLNIVFQDPYSSLNPRLSIGHAIMEPMTVYRLHGNAKNRKGKVFELLEKVGLSPDHFYRYPHEFSGGQRQRIVIARALALQPEFIICDEAVSSLDVSVQAKVLNLFNDLKKEFGFTYIFISHDLSVVRFMSDRILVMKDGKIVESGDADEIYDHPKTDYTKQLIASIPIQV